MKSNLLVLLNSDIQDFVQIHLLSPSNPLHINLSLVSWESAVGAVLMYFHCESGVVPLFSGAFNVFWVLWFA